MAPPAGPAASATSSSARRRSQGCRRTAPTRTGRPSAPARPVSMRSRVMAGPTTATARIAVAVRPISAEPDQTATRSQDVRFMTGRHIVSWMTVPGNRTRGVGSCHGVSVRGGVPVSRDRGLRRAVAPAPGRVLPRRERPRVAGDRPALDRGRCDHGERAPRETGAAGPPGRRDRLPRRGAAAAARRGEALPLRVLHEDAALLVVDKPPGLVMHPAPGNWTARCSTGSCTIWTARERARPRASTPATSRRRARIPGWFTARTRARAASWSSPDRRRAPRAVPAVPRALHRARLSGARRGRGAARRLRRGGPRRDLRDPRRISVGRSPPRGDGVPGRRAPGPGSHAAGGAPAHRAHAPDPRAPGVDRPPRPRRRHLRRRGGRSRFGRAMLHAAVLASRTGDRGARVTYRAPLPEDMAHGRGWRRAAPG